MKKLHDSNCSFSGQINAEDSLFTHKQGEEEKKRSSFEPPFIDELDSHWSSESLRQQAYELCQGEVTCLFDIAATNDLSVGNATKQNLLRMQEEQRQLGNVLQVELIRDRDILRGCLYGKMSPQLSGLARQAG